MGVIEDGGVSNLRQDSDLRMTALATTSSNFKRQTNPLVRDVT
jgi:hypothetical protein